MKNITGKPDQIFKTWVSNSLGEAKFELSTNKQKEVNQAKVWDRNVSVSRGTKVHGPGVEKQAALRNEKKSSSWRKTSQEEWELGGEAGEAVKSQSMHNFTVLIQNFSLHSKTNRKPVKGKSKINKLQERLGRTSDTEIK